MREKFRRLGYILFGFGVALLLEKLVNYGQAYTPPILGHGLYGLIAIVIAIILTSLPHTRN